MNYIRKCDTCGKEQTYSYSGTEWTIEALDTVESLAEQDGWITIKEIGNLIPLPSLQFCCDECQEKYIYRERLGGQYN